jgi:hypothetical protein
MAEPTVTSFACSRTDAEAAREAQSRTVTLTLTQAEAVLVVEVLDSFVAAQDQDQPAQKVLAVQAEVVERRLLRACERHPAWPFLLKAMKKLMAGEVSL